MSVKRLKSTIQSIEFKLLDSSTIKNIAVTQITNPVTTENGVPKTNGLLDPRLGSIDRNILCSTCLETKDCPGHFGYIELKKRVLNPGYISKIKKILECVCFSCSKILSSNMKNTNLQEMWTRCKNRSICISCSSKQPTVRKEGLTLYGVKSDDTNDTKIFLSGDKIHEIFSKISSQDLELMDLTQESIQSMLIKNLLVPPISMRPSIVMEGLRAEDDLTHKLNDILKANLILETQEVEGAPAHVLREYEQLLQFHVATFMNNDISGIPQSLQKSGRPIKSISSRLKGKEGRVRGNLMGKRVDFSSRSVITAEPNINLDELGVPKDIAMIQTFPESCNEFNINKLQELVNNGPLIYPGSNFVIRNDGIRIDLRFATIELEIGMIVERHMLNGDIVLFNRQPSLHKMSMMTHRVIIMEGESFRLNLSATTPYNADFDGDEMNMHMPQSYNSISELELCKVEKNILSPQSCSPCMYIVQDSLVGIFLLTGDVFLDEPTVYKYMYSCDKDSILEAKNINNELKGKNTPSILRPKRMYTGKQIFSLIIPNDLQFENSKLLIVDGILIKGRVCKKTVGPSNQSLIHILNLDYGNKICMNLINNVQKITNKYLIDRGFSVGIGDTIAGKQTMNLVETTINEAIIKVNEEIENARKNKLKRLPGLSYRETFENNVLELLNKARDESGKFVQNNLLNNNNLLIMVQSGSKGSFINISQVTACVGQQNVSGKRIPLLFDSRRTLPHFMSYDYSAASRGFVVNSYLSGLESKEFFFHAMGGREGLIDTACKTSETGYMQRRLIKSMENLIIEYDGSVRDGGLINGIYGGDGFDSTYLERVQLFKEATHLEYPLNPLKKLKVSDIQEKLKLEAEYEINTELLMPFDLNRIIKTLRRKYNSLPNKSIIEEGKSIIEEDKSIIEEDKSIIEEGKSIIEEGKSIIEEERRLKLFFDKKDELLEVLHSNLNIETFIKCSKMIDCYFLSSLNLSIDCINEIIKCVKKKLLKVKISPKEMVGTLASQSIGQPSTQMTLNTFHFAGVTSMEMMGVPRLKEIVNVSGNIKTPSMKIFLKSTNINECHSISIRDKFGHIEGKNFSECSNCFCKITGTEYKNILDSNNSLIYAKEAQAKMQEVILSDFFMKLEIIYDPELNTTVIEEDLDLVTVYYDLNEEGINKFFNSLYSKYIIRITINREKLVFYNLNIDDLKELIDKEFKNDVYIICSDVNDLNQIIRLRCKEEVSFNFIKKLSKIISLLNAGGLKGISRLFLTNSLSTTSDNTKDKTNTWNLQSNGTSLHYVLQNKYVNPKLTISNDLLEIEAVLGIEAAWYAVYTEFNTVIESGGSSVTSRHVELLCDVMTNDGKLRGVTRHGTNKRKSIKYIDKKKYTVNSALKRASFEQTVDILLDAGINNEKSIINSVTDCIMIGKLVPMGTGACELEMNLNQLSNSTTGQFVGLYNSELNDLRREKDLMFDEFKFGDPGYNPDSPQYYSNMNTMYSANSPSNLFKSPHYSPLSPTHTMSSPTYLPTSPTYLPTNSPTSPTYSPSSPKYSPLSSKHSLTSPKYFPMSSPGSPKYSPLSPKYQSQSSPKYSTINDINKESTHDEESSTLSES